MLDLLTWASDGSLRAQGRPRRVVAPFVPARIRPPPFGRLSRLQHPVPIVITIRSRLFVPGPGLSQISPPPSGPHPCGCYRAHAFSEGHPGTRPSHDGHGRRCGIARMASTVAAVCPGLSGRPTGLANTILRRATAGGPPTIGPLVGPGTARPRRAVRAARPRGGQRGISSGRSRRGPAQGPGSGRASMVNDLVSIGMKNAPGEMSPGGVLPGSGGRI
jgi:hypothetical protein